MLIYAAVIETPTEKQASAEVHEDLLLRIATGEQEAFRQLYAQASSAVFAYALSILRHPEDAEDAMQDCFVKIHAAAHLYRARGKPMAWIFTIAKNICLLKLREQRRIVGAYQEEWGAAGEEENVWEQIESSEDRLALQAAFRVLSREESQIVFLHALLELKHREIASWLKLPLSTVLSKYARALKKLRKELERSL